MPTLTWTTPDAAIAPVLTKWPLAAQSLAFWASKTVEGLHYLADVDDEAYRLPHLLGHHPDTVSDILVKAATAAAVTAIDQCTAAIVRCQVGPPKKGQEISVRALKHKDSGRNFGVPGTIYAALTPAAQTWAASVLSDPNYRLVLALRNPLTHAAPARALHRTIGRASSPHANRPAFNVKVEPPLKGPWPARSAVRQR